MFREQNHEEAILRLLRILKDFSHKLQLAICLPLLFKEENILNILKPTEQRLFQETYNTYNQVPKQGIFEEECSHVDPKLMLLLEVLLTYPEINKLMQKLLKNVSPAMKTLIIYVNQFNDLVEERIRTTPAEERKHTLKLRSASIALEKSEIELESLKTALEEQRKKHSEFVKGISEEIDKYQSFIRDTQIKHDESIKRIVNNSESKMVSTYLEMREKQEALQNQIKVYKAKFEKILQEHADREKALREACLKSERQLMASLSKYDTGIGDLYNTKEELTSHLNNLKTEFQNLQEAFNTQATSYTTLREEKEETLMRTFAEQMENFSRNRAAKIIQRTWRAYLVARLALRKKKKSRRK